MLSKKLEIASWSYLLTTNWSSSPQGNRQHESIISNKLRTLVLTLLGSIVFLHRNVYEVHSSSDRTALGAKLWLYGCTIEGFNELFITLGNFSIINIPFVARTSTSGMSCRSDLFSTFAKVCFDQRLTPFRPFPRSNLPFATPSVSPCFSHLSCVLIFLDHQLSGVHGDSPHAIMKTLNANVALSDSLSSHV